MERRFTTYFRCAHSSCCRYARGVGAIVCAVALVAGPARAALTPDSPEVKAAVARGVKFLESNPGDVVGAKAVAALAVYKGTGNLTHPAVVAAQKDVRKMVDADINSADIYTLGLCAIFLAETDPTGSRRQIERLVGRLETLQQQGGGWGYPSSNTGDTSMTQYGVLGLWIAARVGVPASSGAWERVAGWLIRTQDKKGGFGYQAIDPGTAGARVEQPEVRPSLSAAGLGSLYLISFELVRAPEATAALPKGVRRVTEERENLLLRSVSVDRRGLAEALSLGDAWMSANFTINPEQYSHYYYYAFERYQAFREEVAGESFSHANWYDSIAQHLLKTQDATSGSWSGQTGTTTDTAFSVLFLVRSLNKTLKRADTLGGGVLVGGRGLPSNSADVVFQLGNARAKPLNGPAQQLLSVLQDASNPDYLAALEGLEDLAASGDAVQLSEQEAKLRELLSNPVPESRAAAVRALARTGDLKHAPVLIAALLDRDERVFRAADESLRLLGRRFDDPPVVEPIDDARRRVEANRWKQWYRAIRPDAEFLD